MPKRRLPCTLILLLFSVSGLQAQRPTNQAPPQDVDRVPRLVAESDLRLWIAGISSMDVDAEGNIYAFHDRDMQIRMYDSAGKLVRTVGRRGPEPGQFSNGAKVGVVGDTVWAIERGSASNTRSGEGGKITLYGRDGVLIGAHTFAGHPIGLQRVNRVEGPSEPRWTVGFLFPLTMMADGSFISEMRERLVQGPEAGANAMFVGASDTVVIPRLSLDVRGAILDTVGLELRLPPAPVHLNVVKVGELEFGAPAPTSDRLLKATTFDGGLVVDRRVADSADRAAFSVKRIDLRGDTIDRARFEYEPRPYTSNLLDEKIVTATRVLGTAVAQLDGLTAVYRLGGPNRGPHENEFAAVRDAARAAMRFPQFQPPVQGHFIGKDGGVWLRREDDGTDSVRWLVLDPSLNAMGEVVLPENVHPVWSSGNTVWATVNDPEQVGVVWLTRYRLTPN